MATTKKISELLPVTPGADLTQIIIPVVDQATGTTRRVSLQDFNDAIEESIPMAEAAYDEANTATTNAAAADQKALSAGNYANSAFDLANNIVDLTTGGTVGGDMIITGNLTVSGCTASLEVSTLRIQDNLIDIVYGATGYPAVNAGFRVNRGDEATTILGWNETSDRWEFTNDGVTYSNILTDTEVSLVEGHAEAAFTQANTNAVDIVIAGDYANAAFAVANTATEHIDPYARPHANAAYDQANTATTDAATADQRAVTSGDYANTALDRGNTGILYAETSGDYANSAFDQANTNITDIATVNNKAVYNGHHANSAFNGANAATTYATTVDNKAIYSGHHANASFVKANTNASDIVTVSNHADAAYDQANTNAGDITTNSADIVSVNAHADAAYDQANTATADAAIADQKAETSGDYANSAYDLANTVYASTITTSQDSSSAGDYANSAFTYANLTYDLAVTSGDYANSAFDQANTNSSDIVTISNHADAAYNQANTNAFDITTNAGNIITVNNHADAAYDQANTIVDVSNHADAAYDQANTNASDIITVDNKAVYNGHHANSAFDTANTNANDIVNVDNKATYSAHHANAAFDTANTFTTPSSIVESSSTYAAQIVAHSDATEFAEYFDVKGTLIPDSDNNYDLGNVSKKWNTLYSSSVYLGAVQLTSDGTSATVSSLKTGGATPVQLTSVVSLPALTAAPSSPVDGMVAYADGSNWDPASRGVKTLVVYNNGWRDLSTGNEDWNTFSAGNQTTASFNVADNGQFRNENNNADLEVSFTVSPGFTKCKVEFSGLFFDVDDNTSEAVVNLERKINAGTFTKVCAWTAPVNTWFGPVNYFRVDTHGASAGDTVTYRISNKMSAEGYNADNIRQFFGVGGDTFGVKEVK